MENSLKRAKGGTPDGDYASLVLSVRSLIKSQRRAVKGKERGTHRCVSPPASLLLLLVLLGLTGDCLQLHLFGITSYEEPSLVCSTLSAAARRRRSFSPLPLRDLRRIEEPVWGTLPFVNLTQAPNAIKGAEKKRKTSWSSASPVFGERRKTRRRRLSPFNVSRRQQLPPFS